MKTFVKNKFKSKILLIFLAVSTFILQFYMMDNKTIEKLTYRNNYRKEFNGKIDFLYSNRSAEYAIVNSKIIRLSLNKEKNSNIDFSSIAKKGDLIYKEINNDKLLLYSKGKVYNFKLNKF